MVAVSIKFNGGAPGPNLDLPISTSVALTNSDNTGVTTWAWSFLSKPTGSAATIATPTAAAASFTPDAEGSYLVQLVVNASTAPVIGSSVGAVLLVKTRQRIPAALETSQVVPQGWAGGAHGVDQFFAQIDNWRADPNVLIGAIDFAETPGDLALFKVFAINGVITILPATVNEQVVPQLHLARATSFANFFTRPLYIVTAVVDGTSIGVGKVCLFKRAGLVQGITALGGAVLDQEVYVSNTGALSLSLGDAARVVGRIVVLGGGFMSVAFDGAMCPSIQGAASLAVTDDFLLVDPSGDDQHIEKIAGTGKLVIGTTVAADVQILTNNTVKWAFLGTGVLKSAETTNGYAIQNVANPVSPLDGMNKRSAEAYTFEMCLQWGAASTPNANGTTYLFPGFGNAVSDAVERLTGFPGANPGAGSWEAFVMSVRTTDGLVGAGATIVCTLQIAGSPTLLKATLTEGDEEASGTSNAPLFQHDPLSIKVVSAGGVTTGVPNIVVTVGFRRTLG